MMLIIHVVSFVFPILETVYTCTDAFFLSIFYNAWLL